MKYHKGDKVKVNMTSYNHNPDDICIIDSGIPSEYCRSTYYNVNIPANDSYKCRTVSILESAITLIEKVCLNDFEFEDFYSAYEFLNNHENFRGECGINFIPNIEIVKVNTNTKEIDDDLNLNTETRVRLEAITWVYEEYVIDHLNSDWNWISCHDTELDTGGKTFEEAIINMANLLYKRDIRRSK